MRVVIVRVVSCVVMDVPTLVMLLFSLIYVLKTLLSDLNVTQQPG